MTTEPLTDPRFPQQAVAVYDDGEVVGFLWGLKAPEDWQCPKCGCKKLVIQLGESMLCYKCYWEAFDSHGITDP